MKTFVTARLSDLHVRSTIFAFTERSRLSSLILTLFSMSLASGSARVNTKFQMRGGWAWGLVGCQGGGDAGIVLLLPQWPGQFGVNGDETSCLALFTLFFGL